MNKMVSNPSTKPRLKTGTASAPMANEDTTMFAESHCLVVSTSTPDLVRRTSNPRRRVCSYHGANLMRALIRPLILRHSLNPSLLDTEPPGEAL